MSFGVINVRQMTAAHRVLYYRLYHGYHVSLWETKYDWKSQQ